MVKVLAFGTFDPLHEGHSHFFQQAKELGQHLTVVVALDSTITQFKKRPPHLPHDDRLQKVQADPSVDLAILGDQQPNQYQLLKELDFDILALGYDQTPADEFVEQKLIAAGKKKVKIVRLKSHQPHRFKSKKIRPRPAPLYDCHLHSTNSDGRLTPTDLAAAVAQRQLKGLSLTDHNGAWGLTEAAEAAKKFNLGFISGIEISAVWQRQHVHLVAYSRLFDLPLLEQGLAKNRDAYNAKAKAMIKKCQSRGYADISFTDVTNRRQGQKNPVYLFSDIAHLISQRHDKPLREAWKETVEGGALYVPLNNNKLLPLTDALDLIHQAGGIASLAHLGLIEKTISASYASRLLDTVISAGIDALEVHHHDNDTAMTEQLSKLADDNNLLVTGGSDWHGPDIHARGSFGKLGISETNWQRLLAKLD